MSTEIIASLATAVSARKDSLKELRSRISALLAPIPVGVVLQDQQGIVCEVIRACTGASQWANREWDVTIKGIAYITSTGKLAAENIDGSYWDGSNHHVRAGEATCRYAHGEVGASIGWLSGKDTRALALRLPAAIAAYIAECEEERQRNEATLSQSA